MEERYRYQPSATEKKWQKMWEERGIYHTNLDDTKKPKYYALVMFPYPSGDKLHIGHWYNFGPADTYARYMRLRGNNVFEPMGYDAFGLPAENYAISHSVHPKVSTEKNVAYMRYQLQEMGAMYDWPREINTSEPEYYKWTQWMFLRLYERSLAYRKKAPVNWCPSCQTVLANEQVQEGQCERCDAQVTKKDLTQWFFKIRDYAERLLDFGSLDWPERTKIMQENWIGRSEGAEILFELVPDPENEIRKTGEYVMTFTTRADTLYGCTFLVLAPEHPLVPKITTKKYRKGVEEYIEAAKKKTDIQRTADEPDKTGVFTGCYAINPANGAKIPIWIADFVIMAYGTGAVFADAHDTRDFAFAKKYKIFLKTTIRPADSRDDTKIKNLEECFTGYGILYDSGEFSGMTSEEARIEIPKALAKKKLGKLTVTYKLRDWLISRQRYWGAPIPIIYCEKCGEVAVPEKDLPVLQPDILDFTPKGDSKSPLASVKEFVNTKCPKCKGKATRETDTMDTFVDSSWYFLRYVDPHNTAEPFNKTLVKKWLPVDLYIGGPEHACMHLLYARFFTKVLYDAKFIHFDEPFTKLVHQGLITKNGAKMSKSKGNVVSPDEFVHQYGSDVFRMYLMFMGPFTEGGDWSDRGITGIVRFVDRLWKLFQNPHQPSESLEVKQLLHRTIKKVTDDIERFHFNTCLSALMEFSNSVLQEGLSLDSKKTLAQLLAPFAPHFSEEVFQRIGGKFSIFYSNWPKVEKKYLEATRMTVVCQVDGKFRGSFECDPSATKEEIIMEAKKNPAIQKFLTGKKIDREIYVSGRLINFVIK